MKKELVKILPYDEIDFKFVADHHDVHLNGTCVFNGSLHEFENECYYPEEVPIYKIYKIDFITKLKWRSQWLFEKCVGYHYSYPHRKKGQINYYRNPKWLYVRLFNWYCKL